MSDLDQLDGVAAAADAGALAADNVGQPDGAQAVDLGPDYGQEAAKVVDTVAALVTGYAPETSPLWGDQTKANITASLGPVLEKHSITMGALPPELLLLLTAGPVLYQSAKIIATKMEREKQAAQPARPAPGIEGAQAMPQDRPAPPERHPQEALYKVPV
ncbi:hypothetical protein [Acidovorax delafieldii]|uniref:hypothetical protein n=1 Tax=Acidovorax delafieldii TaxID=47920 RepID=UPI003ECFA7C2